MCLKFNLKYRSVNIRYYYMVKAQLLHHDCYSLISDSIKKIRLLLKILNAIQNHMIWHDLC